MEAKALGLIGDRATDVDRLMALLRSVDEFEHVAALRQACRPLGDLIVDDRGNRTPLGSGCFGYRPAPRSCVGA